MLCRMREGRGMIQHILCCLGWHRYNIHHKEPKSWGFVNTYQCRCGSKKTEQEITGGFW
jgi:hypothetical protein